MAFHQYALQVSSAPGYDWMFCAVFQSDCDSESVLCHAEKPHQSLPAHVGLHSPLCPGNAGYLTMKYQ